ncbi:hypothetical protein ACFX2K_006826 [Malus domestica]
MRVNAIAQKWEPARMVPQADRLLIRLDELPQKSTGGVLLPKTAVKFECYLMGEAGTWNTTTHPSSNKAEKDSGEVDLQIPIPNRSDKNPSSQSPPIQSATAPAEDNSDLTRPIMPGLGMSVGGGLRKKGLGVRSWLLWTPADKPRL